MIPQIQKAMTTQPKGLTAAILVFLMLAAAFTAVAPAASVMSRVPVWVA